MPVQAPVSTAREGVGVESIWTSFPVPDADKPPRGRAATVSAETAGGDCEPPGGG